MCFNDFFMRGISTETLLKNTGGWIDFNGFLRNNNSLSLFSNIRIEHIFPLIWPVWDFLQVIIDFLSGNINVICNWKYLVASINSFTLDIKFTKLPFMHIKIVMDLKQTLMVHLVHLISRENFTHYVKRFESVFHKILSRFW